MRIRDDEGDGSDIPMTPLIDVVFLLLIFFLVATNFSKTEVDYSVQIPKAGIGGSATREPVRMIVALRRDGGVTVNGRMIEPDALPDVIAGWSEDNPGAPTEIRADDGVEFGLVARAFGLCKAAGVEKVNLAVQEVDAAALLRDWR